MALEFAEAGNAPTSPTPSSQIRPSPAFRSTTQSPQPVSDNQILAMNNVLDAMTPSPSSMAFPSRPDPPSQSLDQPSLPSPLSSPRKLPIDDFSMNTFMECKECKVTRRTANGDGTGLPCLCMKRNAQASRHCNYAAN